MKNQTQVKNDRGTARQALIKAWSRGSDKKQTARSTALKNAGRFFIIF